MDIGNFTVKIEGFEEAKLAMDALTLAAKNCEAALNNLGVTLVGLKD